MVNREKRCAARDLIKRLSAGEITNDDFEGYFPTDRRDPALGAIYERLWFFWDDRFEHTLEGRYKLNDEGRALIRRCVAFLDSDLEYRWPSATRAPFPLIFLRLLHMGKRAGERERAELDRLGRFGDLDVWPFLQQREWEEAIGRSTE